MWRWPFWSREADRQLAEDIRSRGRVEAERDQLRERLTETQARLAAVETKHDILLAQVMGREAALAYPTEQSKKPPQSTPLGRVIAGLNTREFSRAPSPSTEPAMTSS